jgi:hypothetical protein
MSDLIHCSHVHNLYDIYIYIYIFVCVCVCVYENHLFSMLSLQLNQPFVQIMDMAAVNEV